MNIFKDVHVHVPDDEFIKEMSKDKCYNFIQQYNTIKNDDEGNKMNWLIECKNRGFFNPPHFLY